MTRTRIIMTALLVFTPFVANADRIIDGSGRLLGATNVNVDGALYNVVFADGTCIDVFSGCGGASAFTFDNGVDAVAASQALFDQVLLDVAEGMFDTNPYLTNYCIPYTGGNPDLVVCGVTTAYGIDAASGEVMIAFADNWGTNPMGGTDLAYDVGPFIPVDYDLGPSNPDGFAELNIWAVWTPVPEPGTFALLGLGLCGMGLMRRRPKV